MDHTKGKGHAQHETVVPGVVDAHACGLSSVASAYLAAMVGSVTHSVAHADANIAHMWERHILRVGSIQQRKQHTTFPIVCIEW
jgi:hypothetical protein